MGYVDVLNFIMKSSLKGSALIIVILLVKMIFRNKLGSKGDYYLWIILITNLIYPYGLTVNVNISKNETLEKIYTNMGNLMMEENYINNILMKNRGLFNLNYGNMDEKIYMYFFGVWAIGAIILALGMITINYKFKRELYENSMGVDNYILNIFNRYKGKMNIKRNMKIIYTNVVTSPCLYGIIRPQILIPMDIDKKIDHEEIRYIICHELAHEKRKDMIVLGLVNLFKIIHWFNPIIWFGFYKMRQDCEIACDSLALSYISPKENIDYGHTIINLLSNNEKEFVHMGVMGMLGNKSNLKKRMKLIKSFNRNTYRLSILSILIMVLMGCAFLGNGDHIPKISPKQESKELDMIWPVPNSHKIGNTFGKKTHPILKVEKLHTGIDVEGEIGYGVIAAEKGVVIESKVLGGYGNTIIIMHNDKIVTLYSHLTDMLVKEGEQVEKGQIIGTLGKTGMATRPNLHLEVRNDGKAEDPLKWIRYKENL
ncbi:MAG: peptidoglycan DD-metalloendopeptidase family protein [Anaeromicrobium sp.]|uniref:M56 family metallopeptidase n=1 Tax=Anaeromicrobium sp. TaxID=1929132 RepID=UPI0025E7AFD1|nr:M56 family metallopeptidase [Anaeromicrobium sp.]MCT4594223.1 peptidoglycan DD-metalloendopeptidase family protein [Anaeromicrobium sp.]